MNNLIYLDGASNTPLDKDVIKAMKPYLTNNFVGNSASIHLHGIKVAQDTEKARETIASCLSVQPEEVYFTSGATEANNWVLKMLPYLDYIKPYSRKKKHIIVSAIEHSSVMESCKFLEKLGYKITYVKPNLYTGRIDPEEIKCYINKFTLLVCIMAVNNETGVSNDIETIGKYAHAQGVPMMSDCTQLLSLGGDTIKIGELYPNVDYFTFSAHKIYGPTGVGCLIARKNAPLAPFINGGSQERGLRGGTTNTAGIIGMAEALKIMAKKDLTKHYEELYNYMCSTFREIFHTTLNLNAIPDHKNIMNINFTGLFNESQLATRFMLEGISCSAGSACEEPHTNSDQQEEATEVNLSHVLLALNIPPEFIPNSVRFSFTKYTTKEDIKKACEIIESLHPHIAFMNKIIGE